MPKSKCLCNPKWWQAPLALILAWVASGCGHSSPTSSSQPAPPTTSSSASLSPNTLTFSGDTGEFVSNGQSWTLAAPADSFQAIAGCSGEQIAVIAGTGINTWNLRLASPKGHPLAPGSYTGAADFPFGSTSLPAIALYGNGRQCSASLGSFTVTASQFRADGTVEQFDAKFEQHCQNFAATLRGSVSVRAPSLVSALSLVCNRDFGR
jgi:hypothetical protein